MKVDVVFRDSQRATFDSVDVVAIHEPGKASPEPDAGLLVLMAPMVLAYQVYDDDQKEERRFPVRD